VRSHHSSRTSARRLLSALLLGTVLTAATVATVAGAAGSQAQRRTGAVRLNTDALQAKAAWEEGAAAPSYLQGLAWNKAASALTAGVSVGGNNGAYSSIAAELKTMITLPETSLTSTQKTELATDIKTIDAFFATPNLYLRTDHDPVAKPLAETPCVGNRTLHNTNAIQLQTVKASGIAVTVTFRRLALKCGSIDGGLAQAYGLVHSAPLALNAAIFGLGNRAGGGHTQIDPLVFASFFQNNPTPSLYAYHSADSSITALTQILVS